MSITRSNIHAKVCIQNVLRQYRVHIQSCSPAPLKDLIENTLLNKSSQANRATADISVSTYTQILTYVCLLSDARIQVSIFL